MQKPPHLPPQSCSIKAHQHMQQIPFLLLNIVIASLTGLIIALFVVQTFFPFDQTQTIGPIRAVKQNRLDVEPLFEREIGERTVHIFDTRKKIDAQYYAEDGYIGNGVMLTSDGWLALPYDGQSLASLSQWEVVDGQGISHRIEDSLIDDVSGVLYLNIEGAGYRSASLYEWRDLPEDEVFLSYDERTFRSLTIGVSEPTLAGTSVPMWDLLPPVIGESFESQAGLIFAQNGQFVGFIDDEDQIIPSWMISHQLGNVLSSQNTSYTALPYRGQFIESMITDDGAEYFTGFYVAASPTTASTSTVGRGDVIVRINNEEITKKRLSEYILRASTPVTITVLRDGKEFDIVVEKIVIE